jgi:hypothetical protein
VLLTFFDSIALHPDRPSTAILALQKARRDLDVVLSVHEVLRGVVSPVMLSVRVTRQSVGVLAGVSDLYGSSAHK